jgi:hypothetical protein
MRDMTPQVAALAAAVLSINWLYSLESLSEAFTAGAAVCAAGALVFLIVDGVRTLRARRQSGRHPHTIDLSSDLPAIY